MSTVMQFPERGAQPLTKIVSDEVKALRGRYGVSQARLAEWLGIDQSAVSARLRGVTEWKVVEIGRVAEGFDVHPAILLGGYATEPRPATGNPPILRPREEWAPWDSNPQPKDYRTPLRLLEGLAAQHTEPAPQRAERPAPAPKTRRPIVELDAYRRRRQGSPERKPSRFEAALRGPGESGEVR